MATLLFANNATSTLAGAISNVATTANLAVGTGALFPSPSAGQFFKMTFADAATGLLREIVHVTARTTDTITIVRAQEGTTGLSWSAGDLASNLMTAGSFSSLVQTDDLQGLAGAYAADTGTVNNVQVTLSPAPTAYADILGAPIRVLIGNTNTGATNFSVVSLGTLDILAPNGEELAPGQLVAFGMALLAYDGTAMRLLSITKPEQPSGSSFLTGSGNFVVPAGVTLLRSIELWGGGGSGGGSNGGVSAGSGGGSGQYLKALNVAVASGASIPYACGAGGAQVASTLSGNAGANTTWNTTTYVAGGGAAGTGSAAGTQVGGVGGSGGTATLAILGAAGDAGGAAATSVGGRGGSAPCGGPGGNVSSGTPGAGAVPGGGGGGGGGGVSSVGAAGGNGAILVTW